MQTMRCVYRGREFRWAGNSVIGVYSLGAEVPVRILDLPAWVNRAAVTQEVFEMLCQSWMDNVSFIR